MIMIMPAIVQIIILPQPLIDLLGLNIDKIFNWKLGKFQPFYSTSMYEASASSFNDSPFPPPFR